MSLLVWNYCGLGNQVTERKLGVYTRAKDPCVMFIAETWTDKVRLKIVKWRLKFDHMFNVPLVNRGGGLVLFLEGIDEFSGGNILKKSY